MINTTFNKKEEYRNIAYYNQDNDINEFVNLLQKKYLNNKFEIKYHSDDDDKKKKIDYSLYVDGKLKCVIDLKTESKSSYTNFSIPYKSNFYNDIIFEVSKITHYLFKANKEFILVKKEDIVNWYNTNKPKLYESKSINENSEYFLIPETYLKKVQILYVNRA